MVKNTNTGSEVLRIGRIHLKFEVVRDGQLGQGIARLERERELTLFVGVGLRTIRINLESLGHIVTNMVIMRPDPTRYSKEGQAESGNHTKRRMAIKVT